MSAIEYVIVGLGLTTTVAAVIAMVWWGVLTVFRASHLPEGYTLTRDQEAFMRGLTVNVWSPEGYKVGDSLECVYGSKGAVRKARAVAHRHKRQQIRATRYDHQAWFDKRNGVKK